MPATEEKVDKLEKALADFVYSVGIEFNKLYNAQLRTESEFKSRFIKLDESHMQTERELREFKDETRQQNREMNIKWGEMANKLGTITEDLVAPSIPRIVREEFSQEVTDLIARRRKKLKDGRVKEFDAIAEADGHIYVNSTKSSLQSKDVDDFIKDIPIFREFFPEYKTNKIIGILAGLSVDESVVRYAEKHGFMVLAVGDKLMEVKNAKGFKPREW